MFSPVRLSLKIKSSSIEQQTFRPRSFRRLLIASCCIFLLLLALHNFELQGRLQQRFEDVHINVRGHEGRSWVPPPEHMKYSQYRSKTSSKKISSDGPAAVTRQIGNLPEVVRIPFAQAVSDVVLHGWEDEWFSAATFNYEKFGPLSEPKIDFVYNCEH